MSIGGRIADGAVRVYQRYISKDYNAENGSNCLYFPSCSAYMRATVKENGPVAGGLDGVLRLQRCNREGASYYLRQFGEAVMTTPIDHLADRFEFDHDGDQERLTELKKLVDQSAALHASGKLEESQQVTQQWTKMLKDEVHFRVVDRPGQDHTAPTRFLVTHHGPRQAGSQSQRTALQTALGMVGGVFGAAIGATAFGLAHLAAGAVMGTVAGRGKTNEFNNKLAQRYGPATIHGLAPLEKKLGSVGHAVHTKVASATGSRLAGSIVGLSVGVPVALAKGLWHGMRVGAESGFHAGSILGRNLVGGQEHPAGCNCGNH